MKCKKPDFINLKPAYKNDNHTEKTGFPEILTDYLTGREIAFSNRDNIKQKILKLLVEEKGYLKKDLSADREIFLEIDGHKIISLVDISIMLDNKTLVVWKCSSGSLVSRERQIIASARLLEDYIVPFAAVTNGLELELIDTSSGEVIGNGLQSIPSRQELSDASKSLSLSPVNKKKIANEQRILYTYDAISCPATCKE